MAVMIKNKENGIMKGKVFYRCEICGNLIGMITNSGVVPECCGQAMTELSANTTDASHEKHVPVVEIQGNDVKVMVGEAAHPMMPEHFIEWIFLQTTQGGHRRSLSPGDAPEAHFVLGPDEKATVAYDYCNLHGLWKKEI